MTVERDERRRSVGRDKRVPFFPRSFLLSRSFEHCSSFSSSFFSYGSLVASRHSCMSFTSLFCVFVPVRRFFFITSTLFRCISFCRYYFPIVYAKFLGSRVDQKSQSAAKTTSSLGIAPALSVFQTGVFLPRPKKQSLDFRPTMS